MKLNNACKMQHYEYSDGRCLCQYFICQSLCNREDVSQNISAFKSIRKCQQIFFFYFMLILLPELLIDLKIIISLLIITNKYLLTNKIKIVARKRHTSFM